MPHTGSMTPPRLVVMMVMLVAATVHAFLAFNTPRGYIDLMAKDSKAAFSSGSAGSKARCGVLPAWSRTTAIASIS